MTIIAFTIRLALIFLIQSTYRSLCPNVPTPLSLAGKGDYAKVEAFSGLGDKRLRYGDRNQNRENFTTTTLFPKSLPPSYLATNSIVLLLGTIIINQPGKFRGACSVLRKVTGASDGGRGGDTDSAEGK